jgi:hypothetical protein
MILRIKDMSWEAISAIVQILGTFAVFASLIYLAVQVRQNTKIARSATRHAITETIMGPPNNWLQSKELRRAFLDHLNGKEMSPDQAFQLQIYGYMTLKSWENIHYQYRQGMLSPEEWVSFRQNLKLLMQIRFWQEYWSREKNIYTPVFSQEVESILEEINGSEDEDLPKAVSHLKR